MRDPFFICTSPRSGCHFFMSLLMSTQKVGHLEESLSQYQLDEYRDCSDADVLSCFKWIRKSAVAGEWGTKVDIRELFFVKRYLSLKQIPLDAVRWIWLRRRDKIKQAISHVTAAWTDIWHIFENDSDDKKNKARPEVILVDSTIPPPCLDTRAKIEIPTNLLNEIVLLYFLADDRWQQFFEGNNLTPHIIYYEDFIEESTWLPLIRDVLDFLQISYTLPLAITTSRVKLASDTMPLSYKQFINQDLLERHKYRDELWREIP